MLSTHISVEDVGSIYSGQCLLYATQTNSQMCECSAQLESGAVSDNPTICMCFNRIVSDCKTQQTAKPI